MFHLLNIAGIQDGLFLGAGTSTFHPLNICTFLVPLSLILISTGLGFVPLLRAAAFNATGRG